MRGRQCTSAPAPGHPVSPQFPAALPPKSLRNPITPQHSVLQLDHHPPLQQLLALPSPHPRPHCCWSGLQGQPLVQPLALPLCSPLPSSQHPHPSSLTSQRGFLFAVSYSEREEVKGISLACVMPPPLQVSFLLPLQDKLLTLAGLTTCPEMAGQKRNGKSVYANCPKQQESHSSTQPAPSPGFG